MSEEINLLMSFKALAVYYAMKTFFGIFITIGLLVLIVGNRFAPPVIGFLPLTKKAEAQALYYIKTFLILISGLFVLAGLLELKKSPPEPELEVEIELQEEVKPSFVKKAVASTANAIENTADFVEEAQQTYNGLSSKAKTITVLVLVGSTVFWLGSNFIVDFKENGGSIQAALHGLKKRALRMTSVFAFGSWFMGPAGGVAAVIATETTVTVVKKTWRFPWRYAFIALTTAIMGFCLMWLWANPVAVSVLAPKVTWGLLGPSVEFGISAAKTVAIFGYQVPLKVAVIACKSIFYVNAAIFSWNSMLIGYKDILPMASNQLNRLWPQKQKPQQPQPQPLVNET